MARWQSSPKQILSSFELTSLILPPARRFTLSSGLSNMTRNGSIVSSACIKCFSLIDIRLFVEPNFVGSFDVGEYIYFFFRESAVEYINCGKNIYSRVARVCKVCSGYIHFRYMLHTLTFLSFYSVTQAARIFSSRLVSIVRFRANFHFTLMKFVSISTEHSESLHLCDHCAYRSE